MPDTGLPYSLPYPLLSDEANAPKYLQQLAEAVNVALGQRIPRMSRSKTANQTLPTANVFYKITYELQESDPQFTDGITYNAGDFTVTRDGVYQINCAQHFQNTGTSNRLALLCNGTALAINIATVTANASNTLSRAWRAVAGDVFVIQGQTNVANGVAYGAGGTRYSYCDITRIAA